MARVWEHCKGKMVCEADEPKEEENDPVTSEGKRTHGGCGHIQPQIRKEGLKLLLVYKKAKDDEDGVIRLQYEVSDFVLNHLFAGYQSSARQATLPRL